MLRHLLLLLISPAGFGLPQAPQSGQEFPRGGGDPSDVVLGIDDETVHAGEFAAWMLENHGGKLSTLFAGDWLIEREAERKGIVVSQAEVDAVMAREWATRIDGAFLGDKEAWRAELERTQRSEAGLRNQRGLELRIELLTSKLVAKDRVVPEEKIRREWELSYGRGGKAVELSMLHVHCEFESPADKSEREQRREEELARRRTRAVELRETIASGADFARVAQQSSDDEATRANGGKTRGVFSHFGWPASFLDALDSLAVGELSMPLYARGGWWIVRVDRRVETPLESVRAELTQRLIERGPEQDETGLYRNALVAAAKIEVLPSLFGAAPAGLERPMLAPALSIEGQVITREAYAAWLMRARGEASWPHFLEHWVVLREAARQGVVVEEPEVRARSEAYIEELILGQYKGNREAWKAAMELQGRREWIFRHDLDVRMRIELFCERLMMRERRITPEDVRRRFDEVYGKDGRLVRARLILLDVPLGMAPAGESREATHARVEAAKRAAFERANEIVRQIRDGADFAALARAHSVDPASAAAGGALSGRFRAEAWPAPIANAVQSAEVGEVIEPMSVGAQLAILQVTSREAISFDQVAADLEQQLASQPPPRSDLNAYRNRLVRRAAVDVRASLHR